MHGVADRTNRRAPGRDAAGGIAAVAGRAPRNTDASAAGGVTDHAGSDGPIASTPTPRTATHLGATD
jgi:hypothetical protein